MISIISTGLEEDGVLIGLFDMYMVVFFFLWPVEGNTEFIKDRTNTGIAKFQSELQS